MLSSCTYIFCLISSYKDTNISELTNYIFESEKTPTEYPALIPHEYGMNPPRIRHESGHIPIPFFATTVLLHRLSKLSLAGAHAELSQEDSQQKFNIKNRKEKHYGKKLRCQHQNQEKTHFILSK